ncbi:MAG: LemA family protein [Thermodesulfobacteriota bacterium]
METGTGTVLWVAAGIPLLLIIAGAVIYSGFARTREDIEDARLHLEKLLNHRNDDLVPHLILLVREEMGAGQTILSDLMVARGRAMGAESITARGRAESSLTREVRRLFAYLKNYPDLVNKREVRNLMASLRESETRIGASRRSYNNLVTDLNNRRETFPYSLVALIFGIKEGEYFQTEETPKELIAAGQEFAPRRS